MGYWSQVFSGAWEKTRNPLGWDRKKFALALVSLGAVISTGFHYGWLAMIASATGVFWLAFPPAFAAIILFVWGIIETQAKLYSELVQTNTPLISDLRTRVARLESAKPNYAAVRRQHQYTLMAASRLWNDIDPNANGTYDSKAWYDTFVSAIQRGELKIQPKKPHERDMIEYERRNPDLHTVVTREEFKRYAASISEDPLFLRD